MIGKDVCIIHGGKTPIKHGLRSRYPMQKKMVERVKAYEDDPRIMDPIHLQAILYGYVDELISQKNGEITLPEFVSMTGALEKLMRNAASFRKEDRKGRLVDAEELTAALSPILSWLVSQLPATGRDETVRELRKRIEEIPLLASR